MLCSKRLARAWPSRPFIWNSQPFIALKRLLECLQKWLPDEQHRLKTWTQSWTLQPYQHCVIVVHKTKNLSFKCLNFFLVWAKMSKFIFELSEFLFSLLKNQWRCHEQKCSRTCTDSQPDQDQMWTSARAYFWPTTNLSWKRLNFFGLLMMQTLSKVEFVYKCLSTP